MTAPEPWPPRPLCPPAACTCHLARLLDQPEGDRRILQLTRQEEQRLCERLQNLRDLADLRHMQARMAQQLGMVLSLSREVREVREVRDVTIRVHEQPGLCRKSRRRIASAIRQGLARNPPVLWQWLDEGGLFGMV